MKRPLSILISAVCMSTAMAVPVGPALAGPATPERQRPSPSPPDPDHLVDPDESLGPNWRTSKDRAVISSSDKTGLHILVADAPEAYRWRTAATLSEPGIGTDQWIGQLCLTASGRYAMVVYGPRQFVNNEHLMARGGFAAIVDLTNGSVTKLPDRVALAYHNPGCGSGESVALSRLETSATGPARTWIGLFDATRARRLSEFRTSGQITSATPVGQKIIAVKGNALVELAVQESMKVVATVDGSPHRLVADGVSAVAFQAKIGDTVDLSRLEGGRVTKLATVRSGAVRLRPGAGGRVYAIGGHATATLPRALPPTWRTLDAPPDSTASTTGTLVITRASTGREAAGRPAMVPNDGVPDPIRITAKLHDGRSVAFSTRPTQRETGRSPASGGALSPPRSHLQDDENSTLPYDPERTCAVPRNDPWVQVYQPSPEQVEWAADLAVRGQLTFQRPQNWLNNGLPAYSPQGMYPPIALAGGGNVPAQVLLGILAQESNLWQASFHVVDGSAGNPLTSSGFYGIPAAENPNPRMIDWSNTDCGYGVGQVTTGMRRQDTGQWLVGVQWTEDRQKAVALDYATNVSAALRILQDKWNVTRAAGLVANDGVAAYIENWWFAIWAYNTGFYPQAGVEPWGVGWANNAANQDYPPDRQMFLTQPLDVPEDGVDDDVAYDNAKHPNHWSYPERVIGFAYTSLRRYNYEDRQWGGTYRPAIDAGKIAAQPGRFAFCAPSVNSCDPSAQHVPGQYPGTKPGPCLRDDLKCWWHGPASWTTCTSSCGREDRAFTNVEPRPFANNVYPTPTNQDGTCASSGLPAGSKIVDDISTSTALGAEGCRPAFDRGGTFGLMFGSSTSATQGYTIYPSKVDFHQVGGGFGGHFWFAHTMRPEDGGRDNGFLKVTGTWSVYPTNAWTRVFVHVPDHGAHTQQADYKIYLPGETTSSRHRAIPTRWEANKWLDIGVFDFRGGGTPRIELPNFTRDGNYVQDIAWDAIAVQPLSAKPRQFVVAFGDSYSSGEGSGEFTRVSNQYGDDSANRNSCRRGNHAWSRKIRLANAPATLGALDDGNDPRLDFHFLACSGARTHNVMQTTRLGQPAPPNESGRLPAGSYGELSQLDAGFLDENTTLVVLTIGGNDAGFGEVGNTCGFKDDCANYRPDGGTLTLQQIVEDRIHNKVRPDVRRVIDEIRSLAPNAWIELAGYPELFEPGATFGLQIEWPRGDIVLIGYDANETRFLSHLAGLMSTYVLVSDPQHQVASVDVQADFRGHAINNADSYINGALVGDLNEDDDGNPKQILSMNSVHPNPAGYQAYATAVADHLSVFGVTW